MPSRSIAFMTTPILRAETRSFLSLYRPSTVSESGWPSISYPSWSELYWPSSVVPLTADCRCGMCWPSCPRACWHIVRRQRHGSPTAKCAHSTNAYCCLPCFRRWHCWSVGGGTGAALGTNALLLRERAGRRLLAVGDQRPAASHAALRAAANVNDGPRAFAPQKVNPGAPNISKIHVGEFLNLLPAPALALYVGKPARAL